MCRTIPRHTSTDTPGNLAAREPGYCPCCGYRTLSEGQPGSYEVCPVCRRLDDPTQFGDDDHVGDSDHVSLSAARENFRATALVRPGRPTPASTPTVRPGPNLALRPLIGHRLGRRHARPYGRNGPDGRLAEGGVRAGRPRTPHRRPRAARFVRRNADEQADGRERPDDPRRPACRTDRSSSVPARAPTMPA